MKLMGVVYRTPFPSPWAEGEKIPWDEAGFSQRMLREHLSQDHDAASRRFASIDEHVDWIHQALLDGQPGHILDLGCGPGLYTSRLATLGHECVGIDFGPASIAYAQGQADVDNLQCTYVQEDVRAADYGTGHDLIMFIFGEFNVFRRSEAKTILEKAYAGLADGGLLLLEPHTFEAVRQLAGKSSWYSSGSGLFSEKPHICLYESFWEEEQQVLIERYYTIDALSGEVTSHSSSMQAYTGPEYEALLTECGFTSIESYPSLKGKVDESQAALTVLVARKETEDPIVLEKGNLENDPTDPLEG